MTTGQLVIVCATLLLLALIAAGILSTRRDSEPVLLGPAEEEVPTVGSTAVVHTRDERSLRGTVVRSTATYIVLREASLLAGGQEHGVGGTVRVERAGVLWSQEV